MTATAVPKIEIDGRKARSNAAKPRQFADMCACWDDADRRKARSLMSQAGEIQCEDATAFAAMTAIGLDMLYAGKEIKAKLVKQYEA